MSQYLLYIVNQIVKNPLILTIAMISEVSRFNSFSIQASKLSSNLVSQCFICFCHEELRGSVAERSKALVLGTSQKWRGFESHRCQYHFCSDFSLPHEKDKSIFNASYLFTNLNLYLKRTSNVD